MKYLLLIHNDETRWTSLPDAERDSLMQEYVAFTQDILRSGHYLAGEALQPVAGAATVRLQAGRAVVTDGPFAETREQLGGFYLVEARDLAEAAAIAARIPAARTGAIEVRPVMPTPAPECFDEPAPPEPLPARR